MGLRYDDVRHSAFKDMFGLFDDDPPLGLGLVEMPLLASAVQNAANAVLSAVAEAERMEGRPQTAVKLEVVA